MRQTAQPRWLVASDPPSRGYGVTGEWRERRQRSKRRGTVLRCFGSPETGAAGLLQRVDGFQR